MIVGNEVLLRRETPPERLAKQIRTAAAAVPVPVTYADVWDQNNRPSNELIRRPIS